MGQTLPFLDLPLCPFERSNYTCNHPEEERLVPRVNPSERSNLGLTLTCNHPEEERLVNPGPFCQVPAGLASPHDISLQKNRPMTTIGG